MPRKKKSTPQPPQEGGSTEPRRFILIEMDEHIAKNITAERVRRVADGYKNAKGVDVPGLGGGFRYAHLEQEMHVVPAHDVGVIAEGDELTVQFWLEAGLSIPFKLTARMATKLRDGLNKPNVLAQAPLGREGASNAS